MSLILVDGKILDLSVSQTWIRLRAYLTILGFSKSYAQQKNCIFKHEIYSKNANEKHSLDLNITESNPHDDNEERSHRSLINPEFSTQ